VAGKDADIPDHSSYRDQSTIRSQQHIAGPRRSRGPFGPGHSMSAPSTHSEPARATSLSSLQSGPKPVATGPRGQRGAMRPWRLSRSSVVDCGHPSPLRLQQSSRWSKLLLLHRCRHTRLLLVLHCGRPAGVVGIATAPPAPPTSAVAGPPLRRLQAV
jgi:hypothetical protein